MSDASLLHLVIPAPRLPHRHARESVVVAAALHALAAAVLISLTLVPGAAGRRPEAKSAAPESVQVPRIVFLQAPGPGGGGGGGGNRSPSPPSRAENVGSDPITLPVAPPIRTASDPADARPLQRVALDAVPLVSGVTYRMGTLSATPSLRFSQGSGIGGGVGEGSGTGIGPGVGPGVGPGSGGGFGGGVYRPGNGVTAPTLRSQARPNYTSEAMQRKIQGTVVLELIVGSDGVPYNLRVVRSLDAGGLDEEAIRAAKEWRFNPGRLGDTPVDVLVILVIDFHIR
jgi:periplasmic protein TonB